MSLFLKITLCLCASISLSEKGVCDEQPKFFSYLTEKPIPRLVGYTPSELDPRNPTNNTLLKTSSIRDDLVALRPAFDGLILYGYHEACTPRIVAVAKELGFRGILLAIWQPKSMAEVDGVAQLIMHHQQDLALAALIGNEGIIFGRYEMSDLHIAKSRLQSQVGKEFPLSTTEPLVGYQSEELLNYGHFVCPNIHPVFDLPDAKAPQAVQWVKRQAQRLRNQSNKPVLVKETGFPHAGKAIYSQQTQREFWKQYTSDGLIEKENESWISYAAGFEAFDLPWKSEASGLEIEKSWGLLSKDRQPYPAFEVWKSLQTP